MNRFHPLRVVVAMVMASRPYMRLARQAPKIAPTI